MPVKIFDPTWKVLLTVYQDRKQYNDFKLSFGIDKMPEWAAAQCSLFTNTETGKRYLVMYLAINATPGEIAHEAVHAATATLDSRGVLTNNDNDEPLAYLVEFFVDQIYQKCGYGKKRKR